MFLDVWANLDDLWLACSTQAKDHQDCTYTHFHTYPKQLFVCTPGYTLHTHLISTWWHGSGNKTTIWILCQRALGVTRTEALALLLLGWYTHFAQNYWKLVYTLHQISSNLNKIHKIITNSRCSSLVNPFLKQHHVPCLPVQEEESCWGCTEVTLSIPQTELQQPDSLWWTTVDNRGQDRTTLTRNPQCEEQGSGGTLLAGTSLVHLSVDEKGAPVGTSMGLLQQELKYCCFQCT